MIKKNIYKIKDKILKSEFNQNVLILMTGTTIAQAITIAITPILTRLYSAEDFGLFAIFLAITSIFIVIVNGRYELAIMLPQKDEDAINLAALCILIAIGLSIILMIPAVFLNTYITSLLGIPEISFWIYFIPFIVFITGIYNVLKYLNIRKKLYNDITNSTIAKSIYMTIVSLSLGFLKLGATGLILGQITSIIAANIRLTKNILLNYNLKKIKKIKINRLAKKYIKFPKFSLWAGLSNTSSYEITQILISYVYSIKILGFYFLPFKILGMPSSLISKSIGEVFFQEASNEKVRTGSAKKTFTKTLKKLFIISFIIYFILFFIIEDVFTVVFGENWSISGTYAKILIPLFFVKFFVSPLTMMNVIFNKNEVDMYWQLMLLFIQIITISVAFYFKLSVETYLQMMVVAISIHYLLLLKIMSGYNK